ncbi:MAG: regulatory protein RecX [Patescibacteria group bacterium]
MYETIMQAALKIVSRRRRTVLEMRGKLFEKFPGEDVVIEKVLVRLLEMKYLDDYSYVQAFARDRLKFRPRGKKMIEFELKRKGVDAATAARGLADLEIDEVETARKIFALYKKKSSFKRAKNQRASVFRHLASRGISFAAAQRVVTESRIED